MKITFRAIDRVQIALMEEALDEFDLVANDPRTYTPLDLRRKIFEVDKGLQDVPVFHRGDTIPMETTLLDFRGNPHPDLATALSIQLAVAQLTPVRKLLFTVSGTLVDALTGRVDFVLTPAETDQPTVDEAIGNIRVEVAAGEYKTFEVFSVAFKDSAFSLPT
jgi:hypothetical protein